MKRSSKLLTLLLCGVFFACASGNSVPKRPKHLTAGMEVLSEGITIYNKGCYQRSLEYFIRAHELFSASDQLNGVAMSLNNIGNIYRIMGDIDSAVLFFDESLGIYTEIADHKGVVQILSNKAAVLIQGGRLEEAAKVLSTAEDMALKNRLVCNPLLTNRGILFTKQKDYNRAEKMLEKALAKTDRANLSEFSTVNFAFGKLMFETRRYEEAVEFFETALAVDRTSGFYKGIGDDLAAIGSAYLSLGKNELAADFFKRSIKIYALIENGKKVEDILEKLENISKTSEIDIRVTLHFVNRWIEGETLASPCR